jgi:hypothetical protein
VEEAEIEASLASHRAWVEAGRPGAVTHDEAMTELLGLPSSLPQQEGGRG